MRIMKVLDCHAEAGRWVQNRTEDMQPALLMTADTWAAVDGIH